MSDVAFLKKWMSLPEHLQKEVEDFMDFIVSRKKSNEEQKSKKQADRTPGLAKGMIIIHDNFDDPIEGFEDYM